MRCSALQQKTKHIPLNTHFNLPNQPLDLKFLLTKPAIFSSPIIIQLDPNFAYPSESEALKTPMSTKTI